MDALKAARLRLIVAAVLFFGWLGWLAYLAATTVWTPQIVLSRPQFLVANLHVIAHIDRKPDKDSSIKIEKVVWPEADKNLEGKTIKVAHLEDCAEDWKGPGSYIVPLVKQDKDTFTVAAVGRSPGFPPPRGGEKEPRIYRIYPVTPQTLEQLKTMPRLER
jgi:hypothetical protein